MRQWMPGAAVTDARGAPGGLSKEASKRKTRPAGSPRVLSPSFPVGKVEENGRGTSTSDHGRSGSRDVARCECSNSGPTHASLMLGLEIGASEVGLVSLENSPFSLCVVGEAHGWLLWELVLRAQIAYSP